jgi:hypothetical protein
VLVVLLILFLAVLNILCWLSPSNSPLQFDGLLYWSFLLCSSYNLCIYFSSGLYTFTFCDSCSHLSAISGCRTPLSIFVMVV